MLRIHVSPGRMSISASAQPAMTWFGAKVAGVPRRCEESKMEPSINSPV